MIDNTVYMVSLGCSKNLVDSEYALGEFTKLGYTIAEEPDEAAVIFVNTCAFIQSAVEEAVEVILDLAEYKTQDPRRLFVVAGCLPQRYGGELQQELPEVDIFLGPGEISRLGEFLGHGARDIAQAPPYGLAHEPYPGQGMTRVPATPFYTSYLKIAEGCDNRCSFCAIPRIRGPYRSVDPDIILKEAEELAERGAVELILVAQDTTRYGEDLAGGLNLESLLERLLHLESVQWFRVMYLYPERLSERLIDLMADNPRVLPYFDLPFQHVSPPVLKRMGRGAMKTSPLELVGRIRGKIPHAAIRSTLMTGFPGETDEDFAELIDFIAQARLNHLGMFAFSPEEGTGAAAMKDQVPEAVRLKRLDLAMKLQKSISREINEARVGSRIEALVEGLSEETDLLLQARAWFQAPEVDGVTLINSGQAQVGEIAPVLITQAGDYDLVGEIIEDP